MKAFNCSSQILLTGIAGFLAVSCSSAYRAVDKGTSKKIYNLQYGNHKRHVMDVFLPEKSAGRPLVMIVHGGAWMYGRKEHMWNVRNYLYNNNVPTASINYRLVKKGVTYRQQLEDIGKAVQFAKSHSTEWKVNADQLILLGESAGGHLVLLYGYTHPDEIYKIVSLSGPTDFYSETYLKNRYYGRSHGTFQKVVGTRYGADGAEEQFKAASPLANVADVPTLMFQGNKDFLVNQSQGKALDSVLTSKGYRHEFVYMDGAGHVPRIFKPKMRDALVFPKILEFVKD